MVPTMTLQISIPLFQAVGSWTPVSTSSVLDSRWLTGAQAANGRSLVTLWSQCRFHSGKDVQSCGG